MPNTDAPILDDEHKECPFCAEVIKAKATRCRYCKSELPLATTPANKNKSKRTNATNKKARGEAVTKSTAKKKPLPRRTACEMCEKNVYRVSLKNGICKDCRDSDVQHKVKSWGEVTNESIGDVFCSKSTYDNREDAYSSHTDTLSNKRASYSSKSVGDVSLDASRDYSHSYTSDSERLKREEWRVVKEPVIDKDSISGIFGLLFFVLILFSIFSEDDEPVATKAYSPSKEYTTYSNTYTNKHRSNAERLEASRLADRLRQKGYTINGDEELPLYRGANNLNLN